VPALSELGLEVLQFRSHPLTHRLSQHDELSIPRLVACMRESEEIESLRLALATPSDIVGRTAAELDQARLGGLQLEVELA
jgi:hypothetical protein